MSKVSLNYTAAPGFFIQDDPVAILQANQIGAIPERLGLLDESQDRWLRFQDKITQLNADGAEKGDSYKVFFLGRHGQGYHNVAEAKYGTEAWDEYWSKLNGDSEMTWGPDPLLTPTGIEQARDAKAAWKKELAFHVPVPRKHYSSPLKRALDTWKTIFVGEDGDDGVLEKANRHVTIVENCREEYGEHTCDLRSPRFHLASLYPPPIYSFEAGFSEEDPLWTAHERESKSHVASRARSVLDVCFEDHDSTYISIVAHGGFINGFLAAIGRPSYPLPTGGILPVVVMQSEH